MNKRGAVGHKETALHLHRLEGRLRGCQFRPASGQLRREVGKLRLQMQAQLLDGVFQPVVGGDLLCLAYLHALQIGQDHVGENPCEGNQGIVHERILTTNRKIRLITSKTSLVMGDGYAVKRITLLA